MQSLTILFLQDPEYQRKREQQRMLERQKRLQSSGKRKMLRLEEVEGIEEMTEDPQEGIASSRN